MDQWEYYVELLTPARTDKVGVITHFNDLGQQGWELVSIAQFYIGQVIRDDQRIKLYETRAFFKRKKAL
jgi:hypothetical protein